MARIIDGVLSLYMVIGVRLNQMRVETGWLVLETVAHPVLGGSMDIVLAPTGLTHPVFAGAVGFCKDRSPSFYHGACTGPVLHHRRGPVVLARRDPLVDNSVLLSGLHRATSPDLACIDVFFPIHGNPVAIVLESC